MDLRSEGNSPKGGKTGRCSHGCSECSNKSDPETEKKRVMAKGKGAKTCKTYRFAESTETNRRGRSGQRRRAGMAGNLRNASE